MAPCVMKYLRLFLLLAIPLANEAHTDSSFVVGVADVVEEQTSPLIRGASEERDAHGRKLSTMNWSWTNLLFHLGVCHAQANCTHHPHPGPCGCPDCNKPHPPHFQNSYCENLSYSAATTDESMEDEMEDADFTEDSSRGNGQNGNSRFNLIMLIAAAAAVTTGVAAFVMRKRNPGEEGKDDEVRSFSAEAANGSDYKLMGGMTAAFAAVMAKMGMKSKDPSNEDSSTTSGSSGGLVSKRMSLLQKSESSVGAGSSSARPVSTRAPSFIAIRTGLEPDHDMMQADEGIEVEGPFRPSSQYAI